jgi:hypothetical protein
LFTIFSIRIIRASRSVSLSSTGSSLADNELEPTSAAAATAIAKGINEVFIVASSFEPAGEPAARQ